MVGKRRRNGFSRLLNAAITLAAAAVLIVAVAWLERSNSSQLEGRAYVVDGDSLEWVVEMTSPMPMKLEISATVDGDTISGDVKLGAFGNASFSGERA